MVKVGREIMEGKGLCRTCHTIGQTGALRFPDLDGVAARAATRVPGLSEVEYFAQSMYEPDSFIVPGFNPGMPAINRPPIGLTDQEILCVIAYLQIAWRHADGHAPDQSPLLRRRGRTGRGAGSRGSSGPRRRAKRAPTPANLPGACRSSRRAKR